MFQVCVLFLILGNLTHEDHILQRQEKVYARIDPWGQALPSINHIANTCPNQSFEAANADQGLVVQSDQWGICVQPFDNTQVNLQMSFKEMNEALATGDVFSIFSPSILVRLKMSSTTAVEVNISN